MLEATNERFFEVEYQASFIELGDMSYHFRASFISLATAADIIAIDGSACAWAIPSIFSNQSSTFSSSVPPNCGMRDSKNFAAFTDSVEKLSMGKPLVDPSGDWADVRLGSLLLALVLIFRAAIS